MKSVTFDSNLLPSPFICLDQLITSLTYSAHTVKPRQNYSFFLAPRSSLLSPTSLLGCLYSELLQYKKLKRIVYLREGTEDSVVISGDSSVDFVLGDSVVYDTAYYDRYKQGEMVSRTEFGINDLLRAHHMLYARYLHTVQVVPFVLPKQAESDNIVSEDLHTMLVDIMDDKDTVCIFLSDYSFISRDVVSHSSHDVCDFIHDVFDAYCLHHEKELSLLEVELLSTDENIKRYQGIFAV